MNKTKVVKGTPLYKYKGGYVMNPPKGTYIKVMYYDSTRNVTEIILKKHTLVTEIVCCLVIIMLVVVRFLDLKSIGTIYYDNTPLYNNGILYINVESDAYNFYNMKVGLYTYNNKLIDERELKPGNYWLEVKVPEPDLEFILKAETVNSIGTKKEKVTKLQTVFMKDVVTDYER